MKKKMEKILTIREATFGEQYSGYSGYLIITDKQEIELSISNMQGCCENWGYFMSEDNFDDYIGANLLEISLTDELLNEAAMMREGFTKRENGKDALRWMYEGGIMFVDLKTDKGVLQFVAYNEHNGYYGHEAKVVSTQLNWGETL
jgi:hypothetical protein